MPLPRSAFLFTACQVGAEAALKKEVTRLKRDLRFAYSRPGFVTFKTVSGELGSNVDLDSVFARAYGLSFGKVRPEQIETIHDFVKTLGASAEKPLRLHAWERDQHFPGDEPLGYQRGIWTQTMLDAFHGSPSWASNQKLFSNSPPQDGDLVFNLIAIEENEWWYGVHSHSPSHATAPGGRFEIAPDTQAPSRAYTKFEEALSWSKLQLRTGEIAVELGSAPGGASYALLKRGLKVVGIDPGEMAPIAANHPSFQHLRKSFVHVQKNELPSSVQWLLLDMNAEPKVSLSAVEAMMELTRDSLLGVVLTLKLNHWKLADQIPSFLEKIKELGITRVRATQLASNRQEIVVVGMTRRGLLRPAA